MNRKRSTRHLVFSYGHPTEQHLGLSEVLDGTGACYKRCISCEKEKKKKKKKHFILGSETVKTLVSETERK